MPRELAERVRRALDPDADHVTVREQASAVLRRELGFDLAVWATVDPTTIMWTSCVLDGAERDEDFELAVFENEYGTDDVMKMAELAQGDLVASLHTATGGDPASSARYRDVFAPRGVSDELRVIFHDGTTSWGALNLLRGQGRFTAAEINGVRDMIAPFSAALRAALLRTRVDQQAQGSSKLDSATFPLGTAGAGLVLCDATGRVVEVTDAARALLGTDRLPPVIQSLVAHNRHSAAASAVAVVEDGSWLTFQTTPLAGQIAVVVERIRPGRMADLIVRSRGLSTRERQVLEQVVLGKANKQIARVLAISEWTVQDHVKAILAKFGATNRAELVSTVFFEHYAPLHAGQMA